MQKERKKERKKRKEKDKTGENDGVLDLSEELKHSLMAAKSILKSLRSSSHLLLQNSVGCGHKDMRPLKSVLRGPPLFLGG